MTKDVKCILVVDIGYKKTGLLREYCLCENKGTNELCSNCTADQRFCFHYTDSTIPPLLISKIQDSSFLLRVNRPVSTSFLTSQLVQTIIYIIENFLPYSLFNLTKGCAPDSDYQLNK